MIEAVFLYGSKARGDAEEGSDTDLMGVTRSGRIEKSYDKDRTSFHCYPLPYLMEKTQSGHLFLLHICNEAKAVYDPKKLLSKIKNSFRFKDSYEDEMIFSLNLAIALTGHEEVNFDEKMRRRYFWSIRTCVIAASANAKKPVFSAHALEEFSGIPGLANHFKNKHHANLEECRYFSHLISQHFASSEFKILSSLRDTMRPLISKGGFVASIAGEVLYS